MSTQQNTTAYQTHTYPYNRPPAPSSQPARASVQWDVGSKPGTRDLTEMLQDSLTNLNLPQPPPPPPQNGSIPAPVPTPPSYQPQINTQTHVPFQGTHHQTHVPFQGTHNQTPAPFQGTHHQTPVLFQGEHHQTPAPFQGTHHQTPAPFQGAHHQTPAPFQGTHHQTPVPFQGTHHQTPQPQGVLLTLPPWMQGKGSLPPLYHQVTTLCADPRQTYYINTARIQPILLSSRLGKEQLKQIWSICNQTVPGVLTWTECYTVLGLMALAQQGHDIKVETLASFSFIPIPTLDTTAPPVPIGGYPQSVNVPRHPVADATVLPPNGAPILPQKQQQQQPSHKVIANSGLQSGHLKTEEVQSAANEISFGEFKSAAPNKHTTDISSEFGALKSAHPHPPTHNLDLTDLAVTNIPVKNPTLPPSATLSPLEPPPLHPASNPPAVIDDKYSCFRDIGTTDTTPSYSDNPVSAFSGGSGARLDPDNTDKYAHLRALGESSDQKIESPLLITVTSNSMYSVPVKSESKSDSSQTQLTDFSIFEPTHNNPPIIPSSDKQDIVNIHPNTDTTDFSNLTQFTSSDASAQPKNDTPPVTSDFFDPSDFSVFHSASTNQTYALTELETNIDTAIVDTSMVIPTDSSPLDTDSINKVPSPLEDFFSQTRAFVLTDLTAGQSSDTSTAPPPPPALEPQTKCVDNVDNFIPLQSATSTQDSGTSLAPLTLNQPTDNGGTVSNLTDDIYSVFKTSTLQEQQDTASSLITNIPPVDNNIVATAVDSPDFDIFQSVSDPINSVLIPTSIDSTTSSDPVNIPTTLDSVLPWNPVLPITEPPPLDDLHPESDKSASDLQDISLFNEPPPLDDMPNDDQSEETDVYNFSGFHSGLPSENLELSAQKVEEDAQPTHNDENNMTTTIFSTFTAAALPQEIESGQDMTPLAAPPGLLSEESSPPPPPSPPTDAGERTPLADPEEKTPLAPTSFRDQTEVGDLDQLQDLVFNFAQLDPHSTAPNELPLPTNLNTNYFHSASQPLNSDLIPSETEEDTDQKVPDSTDPDSLLDLSFLSSLQTSDLMKGHSSKLTQPKWTLFDTFSNALQDLNSVPIDHYKNQAFQPKKELSEPLAREESFSHKRTASPLSAPNNREVEFAAFKAATDTSHKPLVRAPSYKLSEDSSSELSEAWSQILSSCSAVVHTCMEKVKSATSVHVLQELCSHPRSKQYFQAVFEVMKIVCRIKKQLPSSWETHSLKLEDIALDWANIKAYLNHGGLSFSDIPTEVARREEAAHFCGVCLDVVGEGECRIAFGGFDYHNTCANFWLNEVRNMLPRLTRDSHGALL